MIEDRDEFPHTYPDTPHLWKENVWLSVVDSAAKVFGVVHISLTNRGHGRFCTLFEIDGRQDHFCNKHPIPADRPLELVSDGRLTYTVARPREEIRVAFAGPRYRFDLVYEARFPIFDYDDCPGGRHFAACTSGCRSPTTSRLCGAVAVSKLPQGHDGVRYGRSTAWRTAITPGVCG